MYQNKKSNLQDLLQKGKSVATQIKNLQYLGTEIYKVKALKALKIRNLKTWKKRENAEHIILHMYAKNHIHMRCGSWDTGWETFFCHFGPFFAILPPKNPENQNKKKMKLGDNENGMMDCSWDINRIVSKERIFSGDIIMLHMYTINDNHMMHGSWDIKCDRQNFLSCWAIFSPFTPVTVRKIKI